MNSIFRIDWISIDIIIICLLWILLISVRIYAFSSRWWKKNKDSTLIVNLSEVIKKIPRDFSRNIKKCEIYKNQELKTFQGTIIVFEQRNKLYLNRIFEALTIIGYNVIVFKFKRNLIRYFLKRNKISSYFLSDLLSYLSDIITTDVIKKKPKHWIIHNFKLCPVNLLNTSNLDLQSILLINPNIRMINYIQEKNIIDVLRKIRVKFSIIMRKHKTFCFKGSKKDVSARLDEIGNTFFLKILSIPNISFRHYETILFIHILNALNES